MRGRIEKEIMDNEGRIFDLLNCFDVDARNIENGMTYLDSSDAKKLSKSILHIIKENSSLLSDNKIEE